jgi:2-polyprenyl-6-hydroxyphenyl methylase / 3-demethylubiquinone-9 3-methyltransferase
MIKDSVNPTEIKLFNALAATWWDENGAMRALHRMNPARLSFIHEALHNHFGDFAGRTALDVGCGGGILSEPLTRMGLRVTGVDAADAAIAAAQDHAAAQGLAIAYHVNTAETLVAQGQQFDVVCALEIIEHIAEPENFMATISRLVKPGGLLFVSTLNRTVKSLLFGKIAAEYILNWAPRGTHNWQQFIPPALLAQWLRHQGMSLTALSGIVFDPLQQDFKLDQARLAINYICCAVK